MASQQTAHPQRHGLVGFEAAAPRPVWRDSLEEAYVVPSHRYHPSARRRRWDLLECAVHRIDLHRIDLSRIDLSRIDLSRIETKPGNSNRLSGPLF
ncbi:MAG: hypothetical protein MJD61_07830 [Proteobacteria bacterium]|nr:hypothetical protein [Pseudomonadota bacterium]